jgi:hypothetical protein
LKSSIIICFLYGIWSKYWFSDEILVFSLILNLLEFCMNYHDLSDKRMSDCHAQLPLYENICVTPMASSLKARNLKFWLPESFRPNWCTSYSEFWFSESLGYLPYKFRLKWINLSKFWIEFEFWNSTSIRVTNSH